MSFHIRGINFICFYVRLYIILLLWTFRKLFVRFSFLFLKSISVNSSLNFKSLHSSRNLKLFLVAFSISLPIFDPGMSFSVNYIDKNNIRVIVYKMYCTQSLSSLMYLFAWSLSLCIAVYSLQLIGAILMIRLINLRNKNEKLYFLATKYM
jgi:hypothetical protein